MAAEDGDPEFSDFAGRRRLFVCWVRRRSLGEVGWDPVACVNQSDAYQEKKRARDAGDDCVISIYGKVRDGE